MRWVSMVVVLCCLNTTVDAQKRPDRIRFCGKVWSVAATKVSCGNRRTRDLSPLRHLAALKELDLSWTRVTDISPLAGLTRLEKLTLDYTRVADLTPLKALAALRHLSFNETKVTSLAPIRGLIKMEVLRLSKTGVADQGLTAADSRPTSAGYRRAQALSSAAEVRPCLSSME